MIKERIKARIINDIKTNLKLIDKKDIFLRGCKHNHKCHLNSVQNATLKGEDVILCMCATNNDVCVHFINKKGNQYVDDTFGWFGKEFYSYYEIRLVNKNEYKNITDLLYDTKKYYINKHANAFEKIFIKEDDI